MAVIWWKDLTNSYLVREKGLGYTPCSVAAGSSLFLTARPAPRPDLTERLNRRFLRDIMYLPYILRQIRFACVSARAFVEKRLL